MPLHGVVCCVQRDKRYTSSYISAQTIKWSVSICILLIADNIAKTIQSAGDEHIKA